MTGGPSFDWTEQAGVWLDTATETEKMGCQVSDIGVVGLNLPGTGWTFACGPNLARALGRALLQSADASDAIIARLTSGLN